MPIERGWRHLYLTCDAVFAPAETGPTQIHSLWCKKTATDVKFHKIVMGNEGRLIVCLKIIDSKRYISIWQTCAVSFSNEFLSQKMVVPPTPTSWLKLWPLTHIADWTRCLLFLLKVCTCTVQYVHLLLKGCPPIKHVYGVKRSKVRNIVNISWIMNMQIPLL